MTTFFAIIGGLILAIVLWFCHGLPQRSFISRLRLACFAEGERQREVNAPVTSLQQHARGSASVATKGTSTVKRYIGERITLKGMVQDVSQNCQVECNISQPNAGELEGLAYFYLPEDKAIQLTCGGSITFTGKLANYALRWSDVVVAEMEDVTLH